MQLEAELRTHDVIAQVPSSASLFQCFFKAFVGFPDLAVNVVVTHGNAHGVCGDRHAFDD